MKENKNKMKNVIIMFICFMMCLALAACAGNSGVEGDAKVITEKNTEEATEKSTESVTNNDVDDVTVETTTEMPEEEDTEKDARGNSNSGNSSNSSYSSNSNNGQNTSQHSATGNYGSTTETTEHVHNWEAHYMNINNPAYDEQVLVSEAWEETVLVREAYDEEVVVKEAWDEEIPGPVIGYIAKVLCTVPDCRQIFEGYSSDKNEAFNIAIELWSDHSWAVH